MKKSQQITLLINMYLAIATLVIVVIGVVKGAGAGQVGDNMYGFGYFKAFTVDSNILMGVCALVYVIYTCKAYQRSKLCERDTHVDRNIRMTQKAAGHGVEMQMARPIRIFYLVGTVAVQVTFLTVLLFLGPMGARMAGIKGFLSFYTGDMFFFHLLHPMLALLTFFLQQPKCRISKADCLWTILPVFIYSMVYLINVVFLKTWNDFYGFTFGGRYIVVPFVILIIYGLAYGLGAGISKIDAHMRK